MSEILGDSLQIIYMRLLVSPYRKYARGSMGVLRLFTLSSREVHTGDMLEALTDN